jgi:predicted DNA repair protein MutK
MAYPREKYFRRRYHFGNSRIYIDILKPRTHQCIALNTIKDKPFLFQANIVMMCGCVMKKEVSGTLMRLK